MVSVTQAQEQPPVFVTHQTHRMPMEVQPVVCHYALHSLIALLVLLTQLVDGVVKNNPVFQELTPLQAHNLTPLVTTNTIVELPIFVFAMELVHATMVVPVIFVEIANVFHHSEDQLATFVLIVWEFLVEMQPMTCADATKETSPASVVITFRSEKSTTTVEFVVEMVQLATRFVVLIVVSIVLLLKTVVGVCMIPMLTKTTNVSTLPKTTPHRAHNFFKIDPTVDFHSQLQKSLEFRQVSLP